MALASSFQTRLQAMEDARCKLLQRLQVEKDALDKKASLLARTTTALRRIQQRCLLLKQKSSESSHQILAKEDEIQRDEEKLEELRLKQRSLQKELYNLGRQQDERRNFYEEKKREMDKFEGSVKQFVSKLRTEVDHLRKRTTEKEVQLQEAQQSVRMRLEQEIATEEKLNKELLSRFSMLETEVKANNSTRSFLKQQLEKALQRQDEERAQAEREKWEIVALQKENQILEERVFEAMRMRDQKKRNLEDFDRRLSKRKCLHT